MDSTQAAQQCRERMQRLDTLVEEAERFADPVAREHTREIVRLLLELHGTALGRMLEQIAAREAGQAVLAELARDELVGTMLLLHGLHPLDAETRVREAIERLRPALASRGTDVEVLAVGAAVRLRLHVKDHGCGSTLAALRSALEQTIYDAAPEVSAVEIEGEPAAPAALVQLGVLPRRNGAEQTKAPLNIR